MWRFVRQTCISIQQITAFTIYERERPPEHPLGIGMLDHQIDLIKDRPGSAVLHADKVITP